VVYPPSISLYDMRTKSKLFTVDGVKVRRVKYDIYVREDEWQESEIQ